MVAAKTRFAEGLARECAAAHRDYRATRSFASLRSICENVEQAFRQGHVKLEEISIAEMFDSLVPDGYEMRRQLKPGNDTAWLLEADAVKTSDFTKIMLHALSGEVLRLHDMADMLQDQVTTTMQTNLERERIPGIGGIGDAAEVIREADPYPIVGESSEYVDTPPTQKRGFIVPITREALFFDRTNLVQRRAAQAADWMRVNKEKRVLSVLVGATNNWNYNGTSYNTYQTGSGGELFDNTVSSNGFTSWRSVQSAKRKMNAMTDPMTGEPIVLSGMSTIVCDPYIEDDVRRIVGATQIRETTSNTVTLSRNPATGLSVLSSPYIGNLQGNDTTWYLGDPKRAFLYLQNWGIETQTAGRGSSLDFHNDIVLQYKVSERGVAGVENPRYMIRNNIG